MKIEENFPLKDFNTFGIDVNAKYFCSINNDEELLTLFEDKFFLKSDKLILGGGSNILLTKDFDGLIIKINMQNIEVINENENTILIKASSGIVWETLIQYALKRNFGGIENLTSIPGSVGAAPIQNIGAYGQELKDTFYSLEGFDINSFQKRTFEKNDCRFAYRNSIFKEELKNKFIITSVTLQLSKNPVVNTAYGSIKEELEKRNITKPTIQDAAEVISKIRKSKLPDPVEIGNAGSFFKNPEISVDDYLKIKDEYNDVVSYPIDDEKVKVPAAWLIEKCGWKGKRFGNYGVHKYQALIIVNYGGAKGSEIYALSQEIKESVFIKFGVLLQEEVNII